MSVSKSLRASCAAFLLNLSFIPVSHAVTIDWTTVGDANNAGDVQSQGTFGSVGAYYLISKHEVTNAQYVEFLNAKDAAGANTLGLYNSQMTSYTPAGGINFTAGNASGNKYSVKSGRGNNPVTLVSFYDSLRFANWLHNGQATGDTESGAYTLLGGTPTPSNGNSITRNSGANVFLTSEDEWYKAAYYKGGGTNAGYWDYATQTDTLPTSDQPPGANVTNSANFYESDGNPGNGINDGYAVTGSTVFNISQILMSDVGAYTGSLSAYGTFDQNGNVFEWNETLIGGSSRGRRGGSADGGINALPASARFADSPSDENVDFGFRVASIPEPAGLAVYVIGGITLLRRWRADES